MLRQDYQPTRCCVSSSRLTTILHSSQWICLSHLMPRTCWFQQRELAEIVIAWHSDLLHFHQGITQGLCRSFTGWRNVARSVRVAWGAKVIYLFLRLKNNHFLLLQFAPCYDESRIKTQHQTSVSHWPPRQHSVIAQLLISRLGLSQRTMFARIQLDFRTTLFLHRS